VDLQGINLRNRGILDRKRKRRYNISSYYQFVGKDEILKSAKKKTSLEIVKRKVKDRIKRKKENHEVGELFMVKRLAIKIWCVF